jgi:beta-glucuronidase
MKKITALLSFWLPLLALPYTVGPVMAAGNDDTVMDFFKGEPDTGYSPSSPLLVNARGRDYQSLNGPWDIIVDEAGIGWRMITTGDYYPQAERYPDTGGRLREHSFDERAQLQVPGDWNTQLPELYRYRGKVLYEKAIELEPEQGRRYFLHFDGANYTTDLFVNNQPVGRYTGGYTAFNFDITDFLVAGRNSFIVRVDAFLDDSTIPTMRTSDFFKYGGITRDVGLVAVPATFIAQYHLYLDDREQGVISGWVQLGGDDVARRTVALVIADAGVAVDVTTNGDGRGTFSVAARELELWSPGSPRLYDVSLSLDGERLSDRVGFRTVSTRGNRILLNGKPMQIRGVSMHEETVRRPGLSNSRDDVLAQFELVKELNANFVRLAHYPHNEYTVKLADEMGLMLWSEIPIVSLIEWENPDTLAVAKSLLTSNITRDMNRAAVVMWSISNESFPQTQARLAFLSELAATARSLDESGRPIASALIGNPGEEFKDLGRHLFAQLLRQPDLPEASRERLMATAARMGGSAAGQDQPSGVEMQVVIADPLGEVVDIVGYNEYFGWYYSKFFAQMLGVDEGATRRAMLAIMPEIRFSNAFGKPMIISEFGAGAVAGLHSDTNAIWSEEYQARVYEQQLKMLGSSESVQGFTPWVLKDFRSHLRELNGIQDGFNRKGLVSDTGRKKLAFEVLADYYGEKK